MNQFVQKQKLVPKVLNHGTLSDLNVWVTPLPVKVTAAQHANTLRTEQKRHKKWSEGRLLAIKDNICTTKEPTTCASGALQGFRSAYAATIVEKLEDQGAVIVGKTNLDEFGMGSDSTNSIHGPVRNTHTRDGDLLSAGGSSGGSAVAVASQQCHEALGTDTGGSVRLPAAYTGIVGFKPSFGLVSRFGVVAYANSLDTVGIMGRNMNCITKIFDIIKGYDHQDPTSIMPATRSRMREQKLARDKSLPLRIGVPSEYNTEEMQPVIRQAWIDTLQVLQAKGHSIHPIALPATKMALSAYYILAPAEASSNLAKYDGVRYGPLSDGIEDRREGGVLFSGIRGAYLGDEVKRRILLGSYTLSAAAIDNYFIKAQKVRRLVQQDFNRVFSLRNPLLNEDQQDHSENSDKVDVIITPTAQYLPPKLKDVANRSPIDSYSADVLTVPASLAGLPATSVPVSIPQSSDGLGPIGMQVIAQYGDERMVYTASKAILNSQPSN